MDSRNRLVRKGNYICGSFIKPESVDGYINCINPGDRDDLIGRFPFSASIRYSDFSLTSELFQSFITL